MEKNCRCHRSQTQREEHMTELNIWEKAMGWRKRQMVEAQVDAKRNIRNEAIEEVAKEIEKMTVFGKDTLDSFTIVIRNLKTKE